jgi:hypothetical protein
MSTQVAATVKYGFRIRTRHGLLVERLSIYGRDEADAEKKLRQMYLHCEIIDRQVLLAPVAAAYRHALKA